MRSQTDWVAGAVAGGVEEMVFLASRLRCSDPLREAWVRWAVGALLAVRDLEAGGGELPEIAPDVAAVLRARSKGKGARARRWTTRELLDACAFYRDHRIPAVEATLRGRDTPVIAFSVNALLPWPYHRYLLRHMSSRSSRARYERKVRQERWSLASLRGAVREAKQRAERRR